MKIRDYYDRVAREQTPNYQKSSGLMDTLVHRPNERFVRRWVNERLQDAGSIADFGCGNGDHLAVPFPALRRLFLNDLSSAMLEGTTGRLRAAHPSVDIDGFAGSIVDIPGETTPCEAAICLGVLNHFDEGQLPSVLATLARLAERKILLYYAHDGFLLADRVGVTFRSMGIHYAALRRETVERGLADRGFALHRSAYAFGLPLFAPLVVQEYRR